MGLNRIKSNLFGLVGITILSNFFSFFREAIFAFFFGIGIYTDAFVMASQIPLTIFAVVTSAISTIVLPLYNSYKERDTVLSANRFLKAFLIVSVLICLFLVLLSEIYIENIVSIFAPGFTNITRDVTIQYTKILMPSIFLTSSISILSVAYFSNNNFFFPAIAGLTQNIAIVFMIVFKGSDWGTISAVYGIVIGLIVNLALLIYPIKHILSYNVTLSDYFSDVKIFIKRIIPVFIGVGAAEINRIIDRALASNLDQGSISALNYSSKVSVVFSAIIISALSNIAFNTFSRLFLKNAKIKLSYYVYVYSLFVLSILIPITMITITLRKDLIDIFFTRGAFDNIALMQTSELFGYTSLGIVFIAIRELWAKLYYSKGDTLTPMKNSILGIIINIILNIYLSSFMGAKGLALATVLSNIFVSVLLFISIVKYEIKFNIKRLSFNSITIFFLSLCSLSCVMIVNQYLLFENIFIRTVFSSCLFFAIYYIVYKLSVYKEYNRVKNVLLKRIY